MPVTYTTVNSVANELGFPDGYFDTSSTPKDTVIEGFINRAEDRIDNRTGHAWRSKTITKEYTRPNSIYRYGTGIRMDLIHRTIATFDGDSGDKLEVWDGSDWIDWVATKTEGRADDFWVDYQNGVIYLLGITRMYPHGVRITYRYGETVVSGGIKDACTMMAASKILNSPEFSAVLFTQAGENAPSHSEKLTYWKNEIESVLGNNQEFQ